MFVSECGREGATLSPKVFLAVYPFALVTQGGDAYPFSLLALPQPME